MCFDGNGAFPEALSMQRCAQVLEASWVPISRFLCQSQEVAGFAFIPAGAGAEGWLPAACCTLLLARFAPSTAHRWCWDPLLPTGCPTRISSRSLRGSGPERQEGGSCTRPRVTLIFCFYEQILATEPKSIASSAGREDLASEKDLDFVLGSLYDLANNDSVGPKWTEMRYWWLLLIKEQDVSVCRGVAPSRPHTGPPSAWFFPKGL